LSQLPICTLFPYTTLFRSAKIANVSRTDVVNENLDNDNSESLSQVAKREKSKFRGKGAVQNFLSKISKIFTPLIPAFIGAGLLRSEEHTSELQSRFDLVCR